MDAAILFIKKIGYLFYLMNPKEHVFESVQDVPDYYKEATLAIILAIILEQFVRLLSGKPMIRINDSVANICQGMLSELAKIPLRGMELFVYMWVYDNYRLFTLPWNSIATWLFCLVGTDLGFYWMHRASHQISVIWMVHEIHHSSEDFNLTAPLRLNVLQPAIFWVTYLPLALAVPPSIFFVHYQLNVVYQYWLHTEVMPKLGIIEYFFVTPTHHRIHHGRNRWCIDKNFGGFLIIWDRIFGTFEEEIGKNVVYGLVHPLRTFNPITIQTNHLQNVVRRLMTLKGWKNKFFLLLKGPGWSPGTSWFGNMEEIPEDPPDNEKYDPYLPRWKCLYVMLHLLLVVLIYLHLIFNLTKISVITAIWSGSFIVFSSISFGILLDGRHLHPMVEICRCFFYFLMDSVTKQEHFNFYIYPVLSLILLRAIFYSSLLLWMMNAPISIFRKK